MAGSRSSGKGGAAMETDPTELDIEPSDEEAVGASPPETGDDRLKRENAQLRATLRTESARRLAAEHGLSATSAELLALVPRDQQEAKAKALAEERGTSAPPQPVEPEAQESPDAPAAAAMQQMGQPPAPTSPAKSREEQM